MTACSAAHGIRARTVAEAAIAILVVLVDDCGHDIVEHNILESIARDEGQDFAQILSRHLAVAVNVVHLKGNLCVFPGTRHVG